MTLKLSTKMAMAATAITSLAIGPLSAPANAAATVGSPTWMTISNGTMFEGCTDAPYSLAPLSKWANDEARRWGNIWGYYNYNVDIKVIAPDGTEADTDYVTRRADDLTSFGDDTGSFLLCDGSGRYVAQVRGHWCPLDWTPARSTECKTITFDRAFTMKAAHTKVALKGRKVVKRGAKHTLKAKVRMQRSTGYYPASGVKVRFQYKAGGRWKNDGFAHTNAKGVAKSKGTFGTRTTYRLRAIVVKGDHYSGSRKAMKVRVR